jgi:hypothetical protein
MTVLTVVMEINTATHFLGFQHGGVVPGGSNTAHRAIVHGGEIVANESMMHSLGTGLGEANTAATMRSVAGLTAAGANMGRMAATQDVAAQLASRNVASGGTVSFQGAVFHGVPDQRYVGSIMDNAVRQLRNSSRTWAFNPTGQ